MGIRKHQRNKKYGDEVIAKIEQMLSDGCNYNEVCVACHIGYTTLNNIVHEYALGKREGKVYRAAKFSGWDFSDQNLELGYGV